YDFHTSLHFLLHIKRMKVFVMLKNLNVKLKHTAIQVREPNIGSMSQIDEASITANGATIKDGEFLAADTDESGKRMLRKANASPSQCCAKLMHHRAKVAQS
ncbi:hypothetical protein MKX01_036466, partial [Papaver californicum]